MTQKESGWHLGEQSEDSGFNPITPAKKRGSEEPSDQPTKRPSPKSDEKKVPSPSARKVKESEELETVSHDPAEGQGGKGKQKAEGEIEQLKQKSELKEKGKVNKEKEIDEIWKEHNGSFLRNWFGEGELSPLNKLKWEEDKAGKKRSVEDILQEKVWIPARKHLEDHYQFQEWGPLKREFLFKYCLEEALKATLKKPEKKELLFTSSYTAVTHETVAKSFCDPVLIRGIERKDDVITIELSFLQKNEVTTQKIKLIKSENHHRLSCNCEEFEKKRKRNKKDGTAPPTPHFCRHAYLVSRCIFSGNPTTEEYWRLEVDPEKEKKHVKKEDIELQGAYLCPVCGDAFDPETVEHKDMLKCGSFGCNFPLLTTKRLKAKIDKEAATSSPALMSQENLTLKKLSFGVDENSNETKKISSQELGQLEQDGAGQYSTGERPMPFIQGQQEQILKSLSGKKDLDSQMTIWKILKEKLPSLLTTEPCEGITTRVWILDKEGQTFEADSKFISDHLPGHRVFRARDAFSERAGAEIGERGLVASCLASQSGASSQISLVKVGDGLYGNQLKGTLGLLLNHQGNTYGLTAAHLSSKDKLSTHPTISLAQPSNSSNSSVPLGSVNLNKYFYTEKLDFMSFAIPQGFNLEEASQFCSNVTQWCEEHQTPSVSFFVRGASSGGEIELTIPVDSLMVGNFRNMKGMLLFEEVETPFGIEGDSGSGLFFRGGQGKPIFMGIYKGDDRKNPQDKGVLVFTPADQIAKSVHFDQSCLRGSFP